MLRRPALRRLDGELRVRDADIEVLREVPMLAERPATTVEQLAADLERAQYAPGDVVLEQGHGGDRYYVVLSGGAQVVQDRRPVNTLVSGAGFGDIALLGDVPRTATVRASDEAPLSVAVLRRNAFLTAVTGYPPERRGPCGARTDQAVAYGLQAYPLGVYCSNIPRRCTDVPGSADDCLDRPRSAGGS